MTKILVTGGAGFAGSHICEHLLHSTDWTVYVLDRLTYAGTLERLRHLKEEFGDRLQFVFHDFRAAFPAPVLHKLDGLEMIIHNGAESHVEKSLKDPLLFAESNMVGTLHVLEASRQLSVRHIIYVSTDEVHGPAPCGVDFTEDAPIRPSNPYAAAKAGGEALAHSYHVSFNVPATITRTMNLFGERQNVEKYIPMTIRKVLRGEKVLVHGRKDGTIGSRKWIHARNQADGLLFLLKRGESAFGETFHIAGEEWDNLKVARFIADVLGRPLDYEIVDWHSSRPGHDVRYSLDDSKIRSLGWRPPVPFEESLERVVKWTVANPMWLAE